MLLTLAAIAIVFSPKAHAQEPFALDGNRHLFVDTFMIDSMSSAALTVNPPQRRELVFIADQPWERGGITSYGNVFYDPIAEEYRFYYVPVDYDIQFCFALATSQDGLVWEKPNLGAVEYKGSTDNNIVIWNQREGTVIIDPNAPESERYAIISSHPTLRTRLFTSPDGIHWTMTDTPVSNHHSDSQVSTFWDDQLERYVHYPRVGYNGRATGRVVTQTMDETWPESIPVVIHNDEHDPPGVDLYTNAAIKYPLAPNLYLAYPTPYYHYDHPGREYLAVGGNDGVIETQLATSRDGIEWTRYRTPYVPLYGHEELDLKLNMMYQGMLVHERTIDQYFGGYAFTHGDREARHRLEGRELGGVFRVEQRTDGFVSVDFDYEGGEVVTEPFTFTGNRLQLNLNTSAAGEARVAILDAAGEPIEPYTIDRCLFINGDYTTKTVQWGGLATVGHLAGQSIRLKFAIRGTKLYRFQFVEVEEPPAATGQWALWRFNEPTDSQPGAVLADVGPDGFDLTLGAGGQLVAGRQGNALAMTGAGAYAALREGIAQTMLNLGEGDWTWEAWLRVTAPRSDYHKLVQVRAGPIGGGSATLADLLVGENTIRLLNQAGGVNVQIPTNGDFWNTPTEDWHHVAICYSKTFGQFYHFIDGVMQTLPTTIAYMVPVTGTGEEYFSIGCDGDGTGPFNGQFDEIGVTAQCLYKDNFTPPDNLNRTGAELSLSYR